ncbi:hypothetical protein CIG19_11600 [Enterobacterales bacterium CwR94]|nr:hypothetical protein CIG19_11600 [Enterobacterales bacterium CwR94]
MKNVFRGLASLVALLPLVASAHVKWFVDYNMENEPVSLLHMLESTEFLSLLLLSTVVIFVTSLFDRKLASPVDVVAWQPRLNQLERYVPQIMRYGTSAFFLTLTVGFPNIILTPELVTENPGLQYVHGLIALTAFHRRTSIIAGVGILFLYSYAVQLYGTFHMLDYLVFIGTGVYLMMQTLSRENGRGLTLELVRFTLAYSFLWGAIEKFMHPDLFLALLEEHHYLTMGLDPAFFIRSAGFVEFCCAWHIFSGRAAGYAGIGLMAFFVLGAVIPFGLIDFIGHFLFIIPMIAILFTPRKVPMCQTALRNTLLFLLALALYLLVAYAAWYMLYYYLHLDIFL